MILSVNIQYDIKNDTMKITSTNIAESKVIDIINEFIRSQIGMGSDTNEPNILDEYHITITLDLSDDSFSCQYDCGNKGLREGILIRCLQILRG